MMKVSDKGLAEIAGHEGIVRKRYLDSVGVWTIGIGHTAKAGPPDSAKVTRELSIPEVMDIFRQDIAKFEARVNKAVKVPLKQHEFDALVSFDFNTGGIFRAILTKDLNAGDYVKAARGFMGWVQPPEIRKRRTSEMSLFRTGLYGNGTATVFDTYSNGNVNWSSGKRIDILYHTDPEPTPPLPPPPPPQSGSNWFVSLLKLIFRIK